MVRATDLLKTLTGTTINVVPLSLDHKEKLQKVADNKTIWTHMIYPAYGNYFNTYFDGIWDCKIKEEKLPFIITNKKGNIVGFTRYLNMDYENKKVEIGSTWYHPDVWGTGVNTEAKLLLLTHAFETCDMNTVELCTDKLNKRSQAAIEKLGATNNGIQKNHMIVHKGRVRDSVRYSITRENWESQVKSKLNEQLHTIRT